jgi:hypothetical protein
MNKLAHLCKTISRISRVIGKLWSKRLNIAMVTRQQMIIYNHLQVELEQPATINPAITTQVGEGRRQIILACYKVAAVLFFKAICKTAANCF